MDKYNTPDLGPDFSKFKKIPPAFAGAIMDWSLGSREITATIVDLIVRDIIAVIGDKVILNTKTSGIMNFEKAFLKVIFEDRKDLTINEFSNIVYKDKFKELIKIISENLVEEGFVKEDYYKKFDEFCDSVVLDDRQKENYFAKYKNFFYLQHPIKNTFVFALFFTIFILGGMILAGSLNFSDRAQTIFLLIFLGVIYGITLYLNVAYYHEFKKRHINFDKLMLTEKGLAFKRDSVDLMNYMKKYPLYEDRLSNELVGYALAFGFGKTWLKKLGKRNAVMKLFREHISPKHDVMLNLMNMS